MRIIRDVIVTAYLAYLSFFFSIPLYKQRRTGYKNILTWIRTRDLSKGSYVIYADLVLLAVVKDRRFLYTRQGELGKIFMFPRNNRKIHYEKLRPT